MKYHVWRLAREALPTRAALRRRGMEMDPGCGCCSREDETSEHIFFKCDVAKRHWDLIGESANIQAAQQLDGGARRWLFHLIEHAPAERVTKIFTVLWVIWKERNDRVWNQTSKPPEVSLKLGMDLIQEWRLCQQPAAVQNNGSRRGGCRRWHRPPAGTTKVNVDATIFTDRRAFGIGLIARDHTGRVLSLAHIVHAGVPTPREAETYGMEKAIEWSLALHLGPVIIETDCETVQQAIGSQNHDATEFGNIVRRCKRRLTHQPHITVVFVRRECNRVADAIAKRSVYMSDPSIGQTSPDWLETLLTDFCPILDH
ncbi:Putative ribonuclease H protein At1g65750 [Linum perenne]